LGGQSLTGLLALGFVIAAVAVPTQPAIKQAHITLPNNSSTIETSSANQFEFVGHWSQLKIKASDFEVDVPPTQAGNSLSLKIAFK
jgi:hypothetical protein